MVDYRGGLEKMIGECNKDIMGTMKAEHHSVAAGYGFSDGVFVTSSYRQGSHPSDTPCVGPQCWEQGVLVVLGIVEHKNVPLTRI